MIQRLLLRITLLPPAVRARIARGLGHRASPANLAALVRTLGDDDAGVREACVESLVALGSDSTRVLIAELVSSSSMMRMRAAAALGEVGALPDAFVPALVPLLRDPSMSVRAA